MTPSTIDSRKFVHPMEKAGISAIQAAAQAAVLTEAFKANLLELVSKDCLAARFAGLKVEFDVMFRVLAAIVGIVMAAVVLPCLDRLATL